MVDTNREALKLIAELQSLAQAGLTYTKNPFDEERYLKLRELAAKFTSFYSEKTATEIEDIFSLEQGYSTPKLDVRAFILQEQKVLLVQERSDGLWTLPGGWADVNESPAEAAVRETREESGYEVAAIRLLALWDKLKHEHPPQWPHAYKCFFHCEILSGSPQENIETMDQGFFDLQQLPPLSTHRVTANQLLRLYKLANNPSQPTQFD